jgi:hypothetical protein
MKAKKVVLILTVILGFSYSNLASELFIKVNRSGWHYASCGGQTIYNSNNTFRFFDLQDGQVAIQIYTQGAGLQVFTGNVNLGLNQRTIAELDAYGNLVILQAIPILVSNWYTSTPNTNPSGGVVITNPSGNYPIGNQGVNDPSFQQFVQLLTDESFDSKRIDLAKNYISKTQVSVAQIKAVLNTMSFDSNRKDIAIYAYSYCFDKQNYVLLKEAFSFTSSFNDVMDEVE